MDIKLKASSLLCALCLFFAFSFNASASDYYGAIYVNKVTGVAATVLDESSEAAARRAALAQCQSKNADRPAAECESVQVWRNSCAAAAWSPQHQSVTANWNDDDYGQAQRIALYECRADLMDEQCKIVAAACTSWDTTQGVIFW